MAARTPSTGRCAAAAARRCALQLIMTTPGPLAWLHAHSRRTLHLAGSGTTYELELSSIEFALCINDRY